MAKRAATAADLSGIVSEVKTMRIRPGDVIVIQSEARIRAEFALYLRKRIRAFFPDNEVIVVDGGIELQVLTDAAGDPDPAE